MKYYSNILEKVKFYEERRGIEYAKTDGYLYKTLKVLYILALVYTFVINIFFVSGVLVSKTKFSVLQNTMYSVIALTVLLIGSLVIMRFKKSLWANIVSFAANILACLGLGLSYGVLLTDVVGFLGFKVSFFYRHLVPLCIMVLLTIWLTVIAIRAIVKTRKNYKKIVENIYSSYNVSAEDGNFTEEEWEEILKNA